jgi:hypothetical protein
MLKYPGQVHVRDLALMLEELLYFYRPDGAMLVAAELEFVLSEYDQWVSKNAEPLAEDVLAPALALSIQCAADMDNDMRARRSEMTGDSCGFYQQHRLVASAHFGTMAKQLHQKENFEPSAASTAIHAGDKRERQLRSPGSPNKTTGRPSSRWSDIRMLIDKISQKTESAKHGTGHSSNMPPKSVSARSALKQQKLTALRMAQETVSFHKFARWVYTVLKCLAEEREKELEFQSALQKHLQMTNGTFLIGLVLVGLCLLTFFEPWPSVRNNIVRELFV